MCIRCWMSGLGLGRWWFRRIERTVWNEARPPSPEGEGRGEGSRIAVSLARRLGLKSGLGPTAEVLSFAPPKESTQRKGGPDAAYSLRSSLLNRVAERGFLPLRQRAASLRRPLRAIPFKSSGARRGIRDKTIPKFCK